MKFSLKKINLYLQLIRIPSWLKNIFVFVPLVFSKHLFDYDYLSKVIVAFITFSFASSIVYIFNDLMDIARDRIHPIKKNRPLAADLITVSEAKLILIIFSLITLLLCFFIWNKFVVVILIYVLINIFYSIRWKNLVIIDVFSISAGFMLRVIGGGLIISVYISNWLILTTLFLSLFLAIMKRRVEFVSYQKINEQREVLDKYSLSFIDQMVSITASGVVISYALYTVSARAVLEFGTEKLIYTTIFVLFGIFRYMYLAFKENKGENVIDLLLKDKPMIFNLLLYIIFTLSIIYLKYD
ncbi:MAG: decaprenyl-phosphate phosphoribosyltransferase [Melioribacter sp.]|uniref:decaprenyl-phosphate phosphoribosyltransferase n=1 Tax=Rosettibacter primus TaxID=3111523 RepID=UPI00247C9604|nr:decaprenyl-phosphate phosphoribosyltransferase [Melioribacter sp.]